MISKNEIKLLRALHQKKHREHHKAFIVEGDKLVAEALASKLKVNRVFCQNHSELETTDKVELINEREMRQISQLHSIPPSIAIVNMPTQKPDIQFLSVRKLLVLDSIRDPGNLGTIIRTSNWFGITDIIASPDTVDCYNSKVVQATMGAILRVSIHYRALAQTLDEIKSANVDFKLFGAFLDGQSSKELELDRAPGALVIGSESFGISKEVEQRVDTRVTIERVGEGESLNAGVAASILMHQWLASPQN